MTNTSTREAAISAPKPLTSSSEIIKIIFERLAELDNLSAVDGLHAAGLDVQAEIISRLSERLTTLEDRLGITPSTTLPSTKIVADTPIAHNPRPGSLKKPKTKGQAFRDRTIAADERRSKRIAEANSKPRTKKGKK